MTLNKEFVSFAYLLLLLLLLKKNSTHLFKIYSKHVLVFGYPLHRFQTLQQKQDFLLAFYYNAVSALWLTTYTIHNTRSI